MENTMDVWTRIFYLEESKDVLLRALADMLRELPDGPRSNAAINAQSVLNRFA